MLKQLTQSDVIRWIWTFEAKSDEPDTLSKIFKFEKARFIQKKQDMSYKNIRPVQFLEIRRVQFRIICTCLIYYMTFSYKHK